MARERKYQRLSVWQHGMKLVTDIYQVTADFPNDERFGLVTQLRRASVSVVSNIAEGSGRGSDADFVRFLRMARGSLFEVETQVLIASRLGFISDIEPLNRTISDIFAMMTRLIERLR